MLDACIPADAAIEVRSRAADDEIDLQFSQWQAEPQPYSAPGWLGDSVRIATDLTIVTGRGSCSSRVRADGTCRWRSGSAATAA